jgi:hypothetical protein
MYIYIYTQVCYLVASAVAVEVSDLFGPRSRVIALTTQQPSSDPTTLYLPEGTSSEQRAALYRRLVPLFV